MEESTPEQQDLDKDLELSFILDKNIDQALPGYFPIEPSDPHYQELFSEYAKAYIHAFERLAVAQVSFLEGRTVATKTYLRYLSKIIAISCSPAILHSLQTNPTLSLTVGSLTLPETP